MCFTFDVYIINVQGHEVKALKLWITNFSLRIILGRREQSPEAELVRL